MMGGDCDALTQDLLRDGVRPMPVAGSADLRRGRLRESDIGWSQLPGSVLSGAFRKPPLPPSPCPPSPS